MDVTEVVQRLGGVATLGEMLGQVTRKQVRHAVAQGRLLHPRHNRYALVDTDAMRLEAVAAGGVLSHLSAAAWWGWKVKHPPRRTIRFLWEEAMFDQERLHAVLADTVAHCREVRRATGRIDLWDSRWTGHTGGRRAAHDQDPAWWHGSSA